MTETGHISLFALAAGAVLAVAGTSTAPAAGPADTLVHDAKAEAERQANPGKIVADHEAGFQAPFRLQADGRDIDTGAFDASPFLTDWDNDGDRDMLVGAMSGEGGARLYLNTTNDKEPQYTDKGWLAITGYDSYRPHPAIAPGGG